jgi:multidrug efflux pump subunit AcrB
VSYNLQVQIPQAKTQSLEDLKNIPIHAQDAPAQPLRNLATLRTGTAVGQYERYNMARVVSITANLHGADLGSVTRQIEEKLRELGPPPPKTNVAIRGQAPPLRELTEGFRSGILVAALGILLILTAFFQSLRLALVVASSLPAGLAGITLVLWLTQTTLNIQSGIGAIMAMGVAVANAILLVTFSERLRRQGADARQAALEGAASRLRPILMTSCAMLAGMLPMALGLGGAGNQSAPLGRAVIGGLLGATLATLFVLPAVFALLQQRASRASHSLDPTDPDSPRFDSTASAAP